MADTYVVKAGDTLSEIAQKFKSQYGFSDTYDFVDYLAELNNLADPDIIITGETLRLSGEAKTTSTNKTSTAKIDRFGLQSNTDRSVYATWTWDKDNTQEYQVIWEYYTNDGIWFMGNDSTTKNKQSLYTAPTNANQVRFKVKPKSKTKTVNNKETTYWTAGWSTYEYYHFSENPPTTPTVPNVSIEQYKLTASLENLDVNGDKIRFQVIKDDGTTFWNNTANIRTASAEIVIDVEAGHEYKVRCRAERGSLHSGWSNYSGNVASPPAAPTEIVTIKALSETSVAVDWEYPTAVTDMTFEIQYTTKKMYFDSSNEVQSMSITGKWTHAEITGLTSGERYYFRVRAKTDAGESDWCEVESIVIGKEPAAPTTWSSTTTAVVGEPLTLYWLHNTQDGSTQKQAQLEIYFNNTKVNKTINTASSEEDKTNSYEIDTTDYPAGTKIKWRVRTCGITGTYSDWSTQRTIDIYAPPTVQVQLTNAAGAEISTLKQFPFYVVATAGPTGQTPVSYHVTIVANESYETIDPLGNDMTVSKGAEVFSKYLDISGRLRTSISANNVNLDNNISYTVHVTVAMNSGLTATSSADFNVAWTDIEYEPNAEISIDTTAYTASITPFCQTETGAYVPNVKLAVYRREFNGDFTELQTEVKNTGTVTIVDPHPALDFARYRIVATTNDTGAVSYCDLAGVPVNCSSVIIQWDEEWTEYNNPNPDELAERTWAGSLLKLKYNIDVSDNHAPDKELVKYIGREHPTSYYGTQVGHTSSWSTVIPADDTDTLYAIRRLAEWMGDVYVREPSGSGYWASIEVSYNQKHDGITIPVTLNVTRVTGGV